MSLVSVLRASRAIQVFRPTIEALAFESVVLLKSASGRNAVGPWTCPGRFLSVDNKGPQSKPKLDPEAAEKLKKKKLTSPRITLIMPDEMVVNNTLEHAERLAKRRNMKLVKILDFDTKTERPLYKLMSSLEYFQEESKQRAEKKKQSTSAKEEKLFIVSSKIGDHDLSIKINQMLKLAKKKHDIRVFVSQDGNPTKADEIIKTIEEQLKELLEKKTHVRKATMFKLLFTPKLEQDIISSSENKSDKDIKKSDKKVAEADREKAEKVKN